MEREQKTNEFYNILNRSETVYDVFKSLRSITYSYGFSHFSAIYIPTTQHSSLGENIIISNWAPEFVRAYDEMGLLTNSSVLQALRSSSKPIEWQIEEASANRQTTELEKTVELFRYFGMERGIYFPTHDFTGKKGSLLFAGGRTSLSRTEYAELHLLSLYVFDRLFNVMSVDKKEIPKITPREIECLHWSSKGKTNYEIAGILSISENTVSGHINSSLKKLNATSKAHAVAKGLRLGLID